VFYVLLTGLGLGVLYWATSHYVDVQITAGLENDLAALVRIDQKQGRRRLLEILNNQPVIDVENRRYLLLVSVDGEKLAGNLKEWPSQLQLDSRVRNIWIEDDIIPRHVEDEDGFWPFIATTLPDGSRLLIAQSVRQAEDLQEFILSTMGLILLVIVGLTLLLGWRMGRLMLERVDQINDTAHHILRGDLSRRIAISGRDDEFDELAAHLNHMLIHIEQLVKGMREVTDNVAHDLRRPLSRLRSRLEVTLLEEREQQDYRCAIKGAVKDVECMIHTFNALLEIAQAEAGSYRGDWTDIDLSTLAGDIGALYKDLAEGQGQQLQLELQPGIYIQGNRHLIGVAISNLLENALSYAGASARIKLQLRQEHRYVVLTVSDSGPGIPVEQQQRVLQRFVRLDSARNASGNGLGLSLVAAVAQLHGAVLKLADNSPGLRVVISFEAGNLSIR
jgi:signal transduction histidine kinase